MRGRLLPLGHPRRDGVRQLFTSHAEQLLTHELGDPERLGHVGDHVVGVVRRPLGQPGHEVLDERVDACAGLRRHWEVLAEIELRRLRELLEHHRRLRDVGLVDHDDRVARHPFGDEPIATAQGHRRVDHEHTTSTSPSASVAVALRLVPSSAHAACGCRACRRTRSARRAALSTPRTCVRVVCGLSETIETFVPRMWLSSVDFPTFGRPTSVTNPDRKLTATSSQRQARSSSSSSPGPTRGPRSPSRRDAAAVDLFDRELPLHVVDRLGRLGHVVRACRARARRRCPSRRVGMSLPSSSFSSSIGTRPLTRIAAVGQRLHLGLDSMSYSSTISPTSSSIRSSSVDEPGGPAVLVDDDRHVELALLHLAHELGHRLGLGNEVRRADDRRYGLGAARPSRSARIRSLA